MASGFCWYTGLYCIGMLKFFKPQILYFRIMIVESANIDHRILQSILGEIFTDLSLQYLTFLRDEYFAYTLEIFIGQTFIWPVLACTNMQCECGHWRQVETT